MSDEDRRYIRLSKNKAPTQEVFIRLVEILTRLQAKTDLLIQQSTLSNV